MALSAVTHLLTVQSTLNRAPFPHECRAKAKRTRGHYMCRVKREAKGKNQGYILFHASMRPRYGRPIWPAIMSRYTALYEARKAMKVAIKDSLEWGTPVLYMRSLDGHLFAIHQAHSSSHDPSVSGIPLPVGQEYHQAAILPSAMLAWRNRPKI